MRVVRVKELFEKEYGKKMLEMMLSPEYYQLTHNKLFPHDCVHLENLGGEIGAPELQNKRVTIFCLPILIGGRLDQSGGAPRITT